MGKFINKSYVNTIDSLTSGMIQKVKTANYVFNNKPPVLCNWYNIDKDATTIDEGSGLNYSDVGKSSPIRYKLIKDAVFYSQGIQIEINLAYRDYNNIENLKKVCDALCNFINMYLEIIK